MAAIGYLWVLGLPLTRAVTALSAKSLADVALPKVIIRRGMVYDLNPAAYGVGVLLGTTLRHARQVCPDLVSLPFVEAEYADRLRLVISVLRRHTHRFEFDGPNRLFVDFAGSGQPDKVLADLAAVCPGTILVAGIGSSKFAARASVLATLACHTTTKHPMFLPKPGQPKSGGRPEGMPAQSSGTAVDRMAMLALTNLADGGSEQESSFIAQLPVGYLWPIAEETRERLYRLGFKTCGEVAACDTRELVRVLGTEGERATALARGIDPQPVRPSYAPDEIIRRVDFEVPLTSRLALKHSLMLLGLDLGHALAGEGLGGRELELTLYPEGGTPLCLQRSFSRPRGGPTVIAEAFTALFDSTGTTNAIVSMEVAVRGLQASLRQQLSFLDRAVGDDRHGTLLETLASLERKFPGGAVRLGAPPVSRRERMLHFVDPLRQPREGALIREPAD